MDMQKTVKQLKTYRPVAPRIALASMSFAAVAITMSAMVVLPAELELGDFDHAACFAASAAHVLSTE